MQTIEEINAVVTPATGWLVEMGVSPETGSEFLRLLRSDPTTGETTFVAALPRETPAGSICAFGGACNHYYHLGRSSFRAPAADEARLRRLPAPATRVESGPLQFGDDWPGVFIRGDDAAGHASVVRSAVAALADKPACAWMLASVYEDLRACAIGPAVTRLFPPVRDMLSQLGIAFPEIRQRAVQ